MDFAGNHITAMMKLWHTPSNSANGKLSFQVSAKKSPKDPMKAVAALPIDISISGKKHDLLGGSLLSSAIKASTQLVKYGFLTVPTRKTPRPAMTSVDPYSDAS